MIHATTRKTTSIRAGMRRMARGMISGLPFFWFAVLTGSGLAVATATAQRADYVIQISVDGLHAGQLQTLLETRPADFPSFRRFVEEGATTFNARPDPFSTLTLPNHTSMLTGRPVFPPGDDLTLHHGYLGNSQPSPTDTLHNAGNENLDYIASTFDQSHDRGLSTALYSGKSKFSLYQQSYMETEFAAGGRPDVYLENGDDGPSKIDQYTFEVINGTSQGIVEALLRDFETDPFNYTFVHFLEPDFAGHAFGWRSDRWNDVIQLVDQQLGQIFELVESQPSMGGNTAIVLTTDHGGALLSHSAATDPNVFRIPFLVWGPDVSAGADLYQLNRLTRLDPGVDRPDFNLPVQPIRNSDSANLAMSLLGLPPVEGSSINARQDLRLTLPDDVVWHGTSSQDGLPGDGQSWTDPLNWSRLAQPDWRPIAGDAIHLPPNNRPVEIDLEGVQYIHELRVDGDYTLRDGEIVLLTGHVAVADGRRLNVAGSVSSHQGIIKSGLGALTVDQVADGGLLVAEGRVDGPLTVAGDVVNLSEMAPGGNAAVQHVQGHYTQRRQAMLRLELDRDGSADRLQVDGRAVLSGTLALDASGDVDPINRGEFTRWQVIGTAGRVGRFHDIQYEGERMPLVESSADVYAVHLGDGLFRRVEYGVKFVDWVSYLAAPGDADGDGAFDTADLVGVLASGLYEAGPFGGADWTSGDWDADGEFNSGDLVLALTFGRFEQPSILARPALNVVPEPSSVVLLAWMSATLGVVLRRKELRIKTVSHESPSSLNRKS